MDSHLNSVGYYNPGIKPSDIKNNILKITNPVERDRVIAKWACVIGFDELMPLPIPEKPKILSDFQNTGKKIPDDAVIWQDDAVKVYVDKKYEAEMKNRSNLNWLKSILLWLKEGEDQQYMIQVRNRIDKFSKSDIKAEVGWED